MVDNYLYALHVQNLFDQEKIWSDYTDPRVLPEGAVDRIVEDRENYLEKEYKLSEGGKLQIRTMMKGTIQYPTSLYLLDKSPILLEYIGDQKTEDNLEKFFNKYKKTLFVDDVGLAYKISKSLPDANIMTIDGGERGPEEARVCLPDLQGLRIFYHDEEDKATKMFKMFVTLDDAIHIAAQASYILLIGGNESLPISKKIVKEAIHYVQPTELFAIPGNSGCYTNGLIKAYWSLCDSLTDIKLAFDEIKRRGNAKW